MNTYTAFCAAWSDIATAMRACGWSARAARSHVRTTPMQFSEMGLTWHATTRTYHR